MVNGKLPQKANASSIQVIKTLSALLQDDYTMNELIEVLNKNEREPIFNNSVISKYINTCRFCGFVIPKVQNRYFVAKIPFGLDLTELDVDIINSLCLFVKDEMSSGSVNLINSFFNKIRRFSNKKIARVEKEAFIYSVEVFERAVAKRRMVKMMFKNRDILECVPMSITQKDGKLYFNVWHKKERNIDSERLSAIQMTGRGYVDQFDGNQIVVFKLKGALAKRYEARPNETVTVNSDGTITVTNKNETKEILFSRLLRYDDKCEIIQPKGYREDMKDLINEMLNNYGEK
jgi:hypothetical protein